MTLSVWNSLENDCEKNCEEKYFNWSTSLNIAATLRFKSLSVLCWPGGYQKLWLQTTTEMEDVTMSPAWKRNSLLPSDFIRHSRWCNFHFPSTKQQVCARSKTTRGSAASSARPLLPVIYIETRKKIAQSIYSSFFTAYRTQEYCLSLKRLCRSYISQGIMHSHKAVTDSEKAEDKGKTAQTKQIWQFITVWTNCSWCNHIRDLQVFRF